MKDRNGNPLAAGDFVSVRDHRGVNHFGVVQGPGPADLVAVEIDHGAGNVQQYDVEPQRLAKRSTDPRKARGRVISFS